MFKSAFTIGLVLAATPVLSWTLDEDNSSISYVSTKNSSTAEANLLTGLSGSVADDGLAQVDISLAAVETNIDIRNDRMREHVFNIASYPVASITAQLDMAALSAQAEGATAESEFEVSVAANGSEASYDAVAYVTRIGADRVLVSSKTPVILYADDLGYDGGIAKLQEIAGLESIQLTVPVNFTLIFDR